MLDSHQHLRKFPPQLPRWLRSFPPRPFDWVQWFVYAAVSINVVADRCPCALSWQMAGFVASMVLLLALDRWEYWCDAGDSSRRAAIVVLLVRLGLIEIIAHIDQFDISALLYVLLPYTAVVAFGSTVGWWIGVVVWFRYALQFVDYGRNWYPLDWNSDDLILFTLGMLFVLMMAKLVVQEQASRTRAEQILADLEDSHEQLRAYAAQVADLATVSERNRLARDIHDSLGHYLTVINVQLEKAIAFRTKDAQVADQAVEDSKRLAREALDDVRRSVGMLRTHQQVFSLRDALQTLVERTQSEHLRIDLCFEGTEQDVSAQAIMTLYRVAQEGLTNVQRHARAGHVTITAQLSVHEARLSIADDGSGFDSTRHNNQTTGRWGGYGLRGVQERLELVAGSLEITTQPGRGTQLIAVVPRSPVARSAGHVLAPRGGQP